MPREERKKIIFPAYAMFFVIASIILFLDQATKFFINRSLSLNEPLPVIKGVLYLTLVHNKGAAFGIFKNQLPLFIIISLFAITLIYFNLKKTSSAVYRLSLSFILAGAVGNLIDRLFFGYVIDFIDFKIWPVFNIADSAITIGAILLGYYILFKNKSCKV